MSDYHLSIKSLQRNEIRSLKRWFTITSVSTYCYKTRPALQINYCLSSQYQHIITIQCALFNLMIDYHLSINSLNPNKVHSANCWLTITSVPTRHSDDIIEISKAVSSSWAGNWGRKAGRVLSSISRRALLMKLNNLLFDHWRRLLLALGGAFPALL